MKVIKLTLVLLVLNNKEENIFSTNKNVHIFNLQF